MTRKIAVLSLLASGAALTGCGGSKSGGTVSLNVVASSATTTNLSALSFDPLVSPFTAAALGANTADQLTSLKYVFGFMSICESLTVTGSAFSNPTGCVQIYSGPTVGDGSSGSITPDNLASYASSQIDMMSSTSRAALNTSATLTSDHVRSYNYAVINWYTPIAVKGCATTSGGLVCTKNTGATYSGSTTTVTTSLQSSATSEAQEAIVVSANGGSFFKFQQPFTITADDITNQTSFTVDMVFNPSAVLTANHDSAADGNLRGTNSSMYVPMLNIAPVPRKGTQTTKRETYVTSGNCPQAKYRVELYYNSDAPTVVLGATGAYVPDSASGSHSIGQSDMGAKVTEIAAATDGSLTLKIPAMSGSGTQNWIDQLTRGANGTFRMYDTSGVTTSNCAYTFVGTATVE